MEEKRSDKIGEYLVARLDDYVFDEFSDAYLEKAGLQKVLKGVPVPFRKDQLAEASTSAVKIASNMAFVIGCDREFKYKENYLAYIFRTFSKDFAIPLVNEGVEAGDRGDHELACVYFRAAMEIDPDLIQALACYGKACHGAFENGSGDEYIGCFKAESLHAFEQLTLRDPDNEMGYYYLGYAYLNLGLYMKAKLTFDDFMRLSKNEELRGDISVLLEKLREPVVIEEGCNAIIGGRYEAGIGILSAYETNEHYNTWWPLWYYLGVAYQELGCIEEAKERYLRVLNYSPSNVDAMERLIEIYTVQGDFERVEKYRTKIKIIWQNAERDREMKRSAAGIDAS
jgi:tetratricopeptide (TPR) repeat protein